MKRVKYLLLLLILVGAFSVRLYRFDGPIADWHSWRQSDTSSVSRNFVDNGFDVLHPKFDDLSNVPSGFDNPNGYRFVEFPIYNIAQAGLYKAIGGFSLEEWGRLVTIFSSLLSIVFIYLLVKKYKSELAGFLAAFFFAFLPFNVYFGRTILPDPSMAMAILGGIYFFDKWLSLVILRAKPEESREITRSFTSFRMTSFLILSIIFTATSFLLKPYALFFTLPMVYLIIKNFGIKFILIWQLWLFAILALSPLIFWRSWIQQYPEGIPVSNWLFNGGNIRFKGAFFYWLFADRMGRLILGYWGIALFVFGILWNKGKENIFLFSFLLSSLLYLFIIARGNVQHDYYQILIIPSVSIFLGIGAEFLLTAPKEYVNKNISYALFFICSFFTFFFSWYFIRDFFNINNRSIIVAGEAINRLTPKNAKIIALYEGDTSFLYQTHRKGWTSFEKPLPEMIKMGADFLAIVNPTEESLGLGKEYKIMSITPQYVLMDLHKKP